MKSLELLLGMNFVCLPSCGCTGQFPDFNNRFGINQNSSRIPIFLQIVFSLLKLLLIAVLVIAQKTFSEDLLCCL